MKNNQQLSTDAIMDQAVALVNDTLYRAKLVGKPFILGILTESRDGLLGETIWANWKTFEKLGATKMEWRDDALRGKAQVAGEELLVSVRGFEAS